MGTSLWLLLIVLPVKVVGVVLLGWAGLVLVHSDLRSLAPVSQALSRAIQGSIVLCALIALHPFLYGWGPGGAVSSVFGFGPVYDGRETWMDAFLRVACHWLSPITLIVSLTVRRRLRARVG